MADNGASTGTSPVATSRRQSLSVTIPRSTATSSGSARPARTPRRGTAPIPPDGSSPPDGAYEQARLCLEIVSEALERAGTDLTHVVRTRTFLTDAAHFDGVARAHGEAFADVRPANTTVVVALLDPAWKVEIEVEAVLP